MRGDLAEGFGYGPKAGRSDGGVFWDRREATGWGGRRCVLEPHWRHFVVLLAGAQAVYGFGGILVVAAPAGGVAFGEDVFG